MAASRKVGGSAKQAGNRGMGRKKGVPNKSTQIAKDAIAMVAERLGGVDRMVLWVKEDAKNEAAYWTTIYPKLLPLQVDAALSGKVVSEMVYRVIDGPSD